MGMGEMITVEVAYATPAAQWLLPATVPAGATIKQAIMASGLLERCPKIDLETQPVGIFSQLATLDTMLSQGDRVEIYRPLQVDPKAQRKARAQRQKNAHQ